MTIVSKPSSAHAPDQLDGHRRRAGDRQGAATTCRTRRRGDGRGSTGRSSAGPGSIETCSSATRLHHRVDVEHRVRDDRRALEDAREDAGLQAERVEERVDDEVAVALAQPDDIRPGVVRAHARPVREHRALRAAGRARGEEDVGEVVAGERVAARGELFGDHAVGAVQELVPPDGAGAGVPRSTTISFSDATGSAVRSSST